MHDLALMADLIAEINRLSTQHRGRNIVRVRVWLGALSHFTPAHFREHFAVAAQASYARNAAVDIETSDDVADPRAQGVVLKSLEFAD